MVAKKNSNEDRSGLFDKWASGYDDSVESTNSFPFAGYNKVLDTLIECADVNPGMCVLDLGTGTGNLAGRFVDKGCSIWGIDYSVQMIDRAKQKLPDAVLIRSDILGDWPTELDRRYDRIVSGYTFHEFDYQTKISLLVRLRNKYLDRYGMILIADIAFESLEKHEFARSRWSNLWDEDEYYWTADETIPACKEVGIDANFHPISDCGGVFVFTPVYKLT
ncbi:MAG: methyltransferase domain-containing protein [Chloroflexota bacterium]|nr:methyltransferase domain-containing protein [Chloroflexota bacterium]